MGNNRVMNILFLGLTARVKNILRPEGLKAELSKL